MVVPLKGAAERPRCSARPARPARDGDPKNVIRGGEMIVAGRLCRLRKQPDRGGLPPHS